MKPAGLGIRMHSGWGILVAMNEAAEVIYRRRMVIAPDEAFRGKQPFHQAEQLGLPAAEKFLAAYTSGCDRLARTELTSAIAACRAEGYTISCATLLLASGRPLPPLSQILMSHALIHAAEGELFRDVARRACHSLGVPVTDIKERELEQTAKTALGTLAASITKRVSTSGKYLGPPWTVDHKSAALAACIALTSRSRAVAGGFSGSG